MSLKQEILNKLPVVLPPGCKPIGPLYVLAGKLGSILPEKYTCADVAAALVEIRDTTPPLYPAIEILSKNPMRSNWGPTPPGWTPPDVDNPKPEPKPRVRVKAGTRTDRIHTHVLSHPWLIRAELVEKELLLCRQALSEAEAEYSALENGLDRHIKLVKDLQDWRAEDYRRVQAQTETLLNLERSLKQAKAAALPTGWTALPQSEYDDLVSAKRGRDELRGQFAGRVAECNKLRAQVNSLAHMLDAISDIANYDDK